MNTNAETSTVPFGRIQRVTVLISRSHDRQYILACLTLDTDAIKLKTLGEALECFHDQLEELTKRALRSDTTVPIGDPAEAINAFEIFVDENPDFESIETTLQLDFDFGLFALPAVLLIEDQDLSSELLELSSQNIIAVSEFAQVS